MIQIIINNNNNIHIIKLFETEKHRIQLNNSDHEPEVASANQQTVG